MDFTAVNSLGFHFFVAFDAVKMSPFTLLLQIIGMVIGEKWNFQDHKNLLGDWRVK